MRLTIQEFKDTPLVQKATIYQDWVKSLIAPTPEGLIPSLHTRWQIGHLGIGLGGELVESIIEMERGSDDIYSCEESIIKEVGDILWYSVNLLNFTPAPHPFQELVLRTTTSNRKGHVCVGMNYWLGLIREAEPVVDQCKRIFAYGQLDYQPLTECNTRLIQYILRHNCIETIMNVNYDKLCTRFPTRMFTLEDATIKRA